LAALQAVLVASAAAFRVADLEEEESEAEVTSVVAEEVGLVVDEEEEEEEAADLEAVAAALDTSPMALVDLLMALLLDHAEVADDPMALVADDPTKIADLAAVEAEDLEEVEVGIATVIKRVGLANVMTRGNDATMEMVMMIGEISQGISL
jgi:hypothetical protein